MSCVFSGAKAMDLCNGGMVWSCCVPNHLVADDVINVRDDTSTIYEDFPPSDPSEGSFITSSHDVTRPPRPERPGRPGYTRPPRLTTDFHHHDSSDEVSSKVSLYTHTHTQLCHKNMNYLHSIIYYGGFFFAEIP